MAEKNVKFYKTKDGTIVVCKDEFARQQIEQLQGIWEAIEELPDGQAVSAQVAIHTTEIAALQSGKANINGSYDSMTVGMAKNVEATSEISGTSLYRPTAGNADVADGVARVLKIGGNASPWNQLYNSAVPTAVNNHKYFCREYNSGVERSEIVLAANLANWFTDGSVNRNVIDLTLMFVAGNEPSSVAAFETWLQNNIGKQNYYPYNSGKLLATKLLGLRTVWLNQWDEEWELGTFSSDGQPVAASNRIRSKNYNRIIPNTWYYIETPYVTSIYFYDENKNYVSKKGFDPTLNRQFETPSNAAYYKIILVSAYGTTYNHDICINLHYTNGRDGEYEPYVEHNYDFDTSKVYGKLNGEGNYVQIFQDGMKSAGTVHDVIDITKREAVVNIGEQNLADNSLLNWQKKANAEHTFYTWGIRDLIGGGETDILTKKYIAGSVNQVYYNMALDKAICNGGFIGINDSGISSVSDLIEALNGVYLWYVKSTPLVYTDLVYRDNGVDTPIDALNILVSNYGTEEQIVESPTNGDPNSCAATLDILYGVNAADFMDAANNGAFVSKASLDALCNTLGSALGGTLTSTWNSAEGHYDFTFTPATRQIENPENNE